MPKLKTHSGSKKRFNLTKTGKVKMAKAFKSHILTKKPTKRTRHLRGLAVRALDAVLFDGGYQILNLKLHKIRLSVFM